MHDPVQLASWCRWLAATWADEEFATAVKVASPGLAARIGAVVAGERPSPARARRMVFSLARYAARWRGRATPFGLFAGVAPLRFGDRAVLRWTGEHRVVRHADMRWLTDAVALVESDEQLRDGLTVVANDLAERHGDRLLLGPGSGTRYDTATTSIRCTRAVERIIELAAVPIPVREIVSMVATEFPADPDEVVSAVSDLIACGALITSLIPPSAGGYDLAHVVDRLRAADTAPTSPATSIVGSISDLHRRLREPAGPASRPHGADLDRRTAVTTVLGCAVEVPHSVGEVTAAAVDSLERLAPSGEHAAWRAYRHRFLDRYGLGAVVPVADLITPGIGLDYPWTTDQAGTPIPAPMTARDERLFDLAQHAALDRVHEVVLDDELITTLTRPSPNGARAPHVDAIVDVRAATRSDLDSGAFTVAVHGIGRTAIASTGRFLATLDEDDRRRMIARYRDLPVVTRGAVAAQLSYRPTSTAARGVASVPAVLQHVLPVGEHPGVGQTVVRVDELAVTADHRGLYLLSMTTGQVIEPTAVNALARRAMPDLVRFLVELPRAGCPGVAPFHWGAAAGLPFRPRLRHGRAVLSAASWKVDPVLLPDPSAPHRAWADALRALRDRRGIPSVVQVGEGDRQLRLDLDQRRDVDLLRAHLDRTPAADLTEAPSPADHGWIDGRAHEIVVPVVSTTGPADPPDVLESGRPRVVVRRDHGVLPGGDVLSARLDCPPAAVDPILLRHLPNLLGRWDTPPRWWFVRLMHPAPHLRIRLHVERYGPAAERIGAWAGALRRAGLCGDLTLDTYRPETGRYGGHQAMDAAERFFAADSAAARAQLVTLRRMPEIDPTALTAASMVDLACALHDTRSDGVAWLVRRADLVSGSRSVDRAVLGQSLALTATTGATHAAFDEPDLATAWAGRRRAARKYARVLTVDGRAVPDTVLVSLLHLHHVRALGPDAAREASCNRVARAVALSRTSRTSSQEVSA